MYKNCLYNIQGDFICNIKENFDNSSVLQEKIIKKYNIMMETKKNYNTQYNNFLIAQEKLNSTNVQDKNYKQYLQIFNNQSKLTDDYKKLNSLLLNEYNNANSQYYNEVINQDKINQEILQEQIIFNENNNDIKNSLINNLTTSEKRYNQAINENYKYK